MQITKTNTSKIVNKDLFDKTYINDLTFIERLGQDMDSFLYNNKASFFVLGLLPMILGTIGFALLLPSSVILAAIAVISGFAFAAFNANIASPYYTISNSISNKFHFLRRKKVLKNNLNQKLLGVKNYGYSFFDVEYFEPKISCNGSQLTIQLNTQFFLHDFKRGWLKQSGEKNFEKSFTIDTDHVGWREYIQDQKLILRQEVDAYLQQRNKQVFHLEMTKNEDKELFDEVKYILNKV